MVRTRDNPARKAIAAKAPRKLTTAAPTASPKGKCSGSSGRSNKVVKRPTPNWQKPIDGFFKPSTSSSAVTEEEEENEEPKASNEQPDHPDEIEL